MNEALNILILKSFQPCTTIDFGTVINGKSAFQILCLRNDFEFDQEIEVTKNPSNNFKLSFEKAVVECGSSAKLEITWSPTAIGNICEKITFKVGSVHLQAKLLGTVIEAKAIPPKKTSKIVRRPLTTNLKVKPELVNGTVLSVKKKYLAEDKENVLPEPIRNIEISPSSNQISTSSPLERNAGMSSINSIDFNDSWLKNQEDRFVKWLNYILISSQRKTKVEDLKLREAEYKQKAKLLYKKAEVVKVLTKIDTEITKDALNIKPEVLFRTNTTHFNHLLEMVSSYHNSWLLLAMETFFNLDSGVNTISACSDSYLRTVVADRILWNTSLAKLHGMKTGSLFTTKAFDLELNRHILKRFFSLVFFLDVAKRENLLAEDINLFKKESEIKSSSNLVLHFTNLFIRGEGSILKRLNNWGCVLKFTQCELDDYDFSVKNLSEDLCDGIRLAKLAKILIGVDIIPSLRVPAIDLNRKTHNITLAMNAFKQAHTIIVTYSGEEIEPSQILWGHREKTLALLWCILSTHHIDAVIERDKLLEEIRKLGSIVPASLSGKELLLSWVQVVCKQYNMDFVGISDFDDGRALCLLIHHYLPDYLRLTEIRKRVSSIDEEDPRDRNFKTFFDKLKQIGGVPMMIQNDRIPTSEFIYTTLAFFSSRLIDLMRLYRAANCIQRAWRKYRVKYMLKTHYMKYEPQVIVVQSFVRRYLQFKAWQTFKSKVLICQSAVRRYLAVRRFQQMKNAAILIQKNIRGYCIRKQYLKMRRITVLLQANFRRFRDRKRYLVSYKSVLTIQKYARRYLCKLKFKILLDSFRKYMKIKNAVRDVERYYIGYKERKRFLDLRNSSIIIQKNLRMIITRRAFIKLKQSAICIQKYVRGYAMRNQYLSLKTSAIILQKNFRMKTVRNFFIKQKQSAICIQKKIRSHIARKRFLSQKSSAIVIQKNFRAYKEKKNYQNYRKALVSIQRYTRGFLVRKQLRKEKQASVKIQSAYRSFVCRRNYLKIQESVVILQKQVRGFLVRRTYKKTISSIVLCQSIIRMHQNRQSYIRTLKAVILIQRQTRKVLARKTFLKAKQSIITVQKCVRMFLFRKEFVAMKSAAIIIQKNTRRFLIRKNYTTCRQSAILIQRTFRGFIVRKQIRINNCAAVTIQKQLRSFICKKRYQILRESVIRIQKTFRGFIARQQFTKDIRSIRLLQSKIRMIIQKKKYRQKIDAVNKLKYFFQGVLIRKKYLIKRFAAIFIQKTFRGFLCRQKFSLMKKSAVLIQSQFRGHVQRSIYRKKLSSVLVIQKSIRGYLVRKTIRQQNQAATCIQRFYRSHKCRVNFLVQREAALMIQRQIRGYQTRKQYLEIKRKIILIQSIIRMKLAVWKFNRLRSAALTIEKNFRGFIVRRNFLKQKQSALIIQKTFRRYSCQQKFLKLRHSVIVLQKYWRGYIDRKLYSRQKQAAICLQKHIRRYIDRNRFIALKTSAVIIQKHIRRVLVERMMMTNHNAALIIQKNVRSFLTRKKFLLQKSSSILIQSCFRGYSCFIRYQTMRNSSIVIQKNVRGFLVRKTYRKIIDCTIIIQKNFRSVILRKKFLEMKQSAVIIQKSIRRYLAQKNYEKMKKSIILLQKISRRIIQRNRYLNMKRSAIIIQKSIRGYLTRLEHRKTLASIIVVQSIIRRFLVKRRFEKMKNATILIQSTFRGYLARRSFKSQQNAALIIQKSIRGYLTRQNYLRKRQASIVIGKYVRGFLTRRFFEQNKNQMKLRNQSIFNQRQRAAVVIQAAFRSFIAKRNYQLTRQAIVFVQLRLKFVFHKRRKAARIIQRFFHGVRRHRAALTIQRIWRGQKVRNQLREKQIGREIGEIRTRFIEANRRYSKFNTVRFIGVKALEDLKKSNITVSRILNCLSALEKVTSLSREICKWLIDSNAYNILVDLIHDCNRGVADLEVVSKSISVLFNLGKAGVLNLEIIGSEVGTFLKDLLVRNVNAKKGTKGVTVFCHTCLLLVLLVEQERNSLPNNYYTNQYLICNDLLIKSSIFEMRQSLINRSDGNNNHSNFGSNSYSDKILEQMRLKPSWDLNRKKIRKPVLFANKIRGSTTSLQEIKSSMAPPPPPSPSALPVQHFDGVFRKPILPIPARPSRKAPGTYQKLMTRSSSVSSNPQRTASADANRKSSNIWDICHQLYAINMLCSVFDV